MAMHPDLAKRLTLWKDALLELRKAEGEFRKADALRKCIFAQMVTAAKDQAKSVAEREYIVESSPAWEALVVALAEAETEYNFRRGDYELKQNAFYGMLASVKRESEHIDRRGGAA